MRKIVRLMTAGILMSALSGSVRADEAKRPPMPTTPGHHMERMEKVLNLTPEQETKVREIQKAMVEKVKAMREDTDSQIRAILTDEQKTKFDNWKKERMEHRQDRREEWREHQSEKAPTK